MFKEEIPSFKRKRYVFWLSFVCFYCYQCFSTHFVQYSLQIHFSDHILSDLRLLTPFFCQKLAHHSVGLVVDCSPSMQEIAGGLIPGLDRPKLLKQLHCKMLNNKYECHGSLEMTIIDGWPMSL